MRTPLFKQVDRLVAMAVLSSVGLAWLVITGFDAFTAFVGEINHVGRGQYTFVNALVYVLLTAPRRAYEMFGYAGLIGGLMGLGALASSGELTALRAAGLSKLRICASVVIALIALTGIVTVIGETIGPWGEQKAQALSLAAKTKDITLAKGGSLWARDAGTVINARRGRTQQAADGGNIVELTNVHAFEFNPEGRLTGLVQAAHATHARGVWTLYDVRRTELEVNSAKSTQQATMQWKSGLDPQLLALSIIRPQYMAARDLGRNIAYLERNDQDASSFRQAYWERLFYGFNVLTLAFCAMPFAFGALRSGGLSKRLFLGMVLAIGFYFLQRAIVNMGVVYDVHPAVANLVAPLLLIGLATMYFRRHA